MDIRREIGARMTVKTRRIEVNNIGGMVGTRDNAWTEGMNEENFVL
jgi:hypothetical protein